MKKFSLIFAAAFCLVFNTSSYILNEDNTDINGNSTEVVDNNDVDAVKEALQSGWTDAEIAKANTAAHVSSLSQMDKDIILYCNLARLDGAKFWRTYGKANAKGSSSNVASLERDLSMVRNYPMYIPEASLMKAAAYHANDMSQNNFFDHDSSDGTDFGDRLYSFYDGNAIAENISAGSNTAISVVMQLLIDDGVPSLGHRKNILSSKYTAIGVKSASHRSWGSVTVQDFGDRVINEMQ